MSAVQAALSEETRSVLVQARMQEMRAKEARDKADAERLEAERLAALRSAVDAASIDWEAEALLSFEKVPREQLHILLARPNQGIRRSTIQPTIQHLPTDLNAETCNLAYMLPNIRDGLTEEHVPKPYTLINERARFRIRMLRQLFQSLQADAAAVAAEAARVTAAKVAEEARIAAEKAGAVKAAAKEEYRIRMNGIVASSLADTVDFRTIQHNYTDCEAPDTLFAAYKEYRPTGRHFLDVRRIMMGQMQAAHVRVPESWNNHYETGKTPFLTVCPVCKKAPWMHPTEFNYMQYTGGRVECTDHYKWEPSTNTHYKWTLIPPPPPPAPSPPAHPAYARPQSIQLPVNYIPPPSGHWQLWDPKDPDGAKATQAAKEKKIVDTKAEIARLAATLE